MRASRSRPCAARRGRPHEGPGRRVRVHEGLRLEGEHVDELRLHVAREARGVGLGPGVGEVDVPEERAAQVAECVVALERRVVGGGAPAEALLHLLEAPGDLEEVVDPPLLHVEHGLVPPVLEDLRRDVVGPARVLEAEPHVAEPRVEAHQLEGRVVRVRHLKVADELGQVRLLAALGEGRDGNVVVGRLLVVKTDGSVQPVHEGALRGAGPAAGLRRAAVHRGVRRGRRR
mmetsp:Transcript_26937/g.90184  ORF Transcript_26937/g.90184 Transcript_26937/m.90184 type:complete len:231 (+) Transcript_26937:69-761(+)